MTYFSRFISQDPGIIASLSLRPYTALLHVDKAHVNEETTCGGLLYLPYAAVEAERTRQPAREATIVKINQNLKYDECGDPAPNQVLMAESELALLTPGRRVLFSVHLDESEDEYILVKLGQILAVAV